MKRCLMGIAIGCAFAMIVMSATAFAVSTVTLGSANALPGQQDVVIPVFINNEVPVRAVVAPFMIRKLGPAYVDRIKLDIGGRMVGEINDIVFYNQYDNGTLPDALCKRYTDVQPGTPGGFTGAPSYSVASDYGTSKQIVHGVPYGLNFVRSRIFPPSLAPGVDRTGSLLITADISEDEGCFEIDTTCMEPAQHLLLVDDFNFGVPLTFAGSTIHVGACEGTILGIPNPFSLSPGNGMSGPQDITLSWAAVPNAAAYELQVDNVDETFTHLIVEATVQGTEFALSIADGETIHWRVRAVPMNCDYCLGDWVGPSGAPSVSVAIDIKPQSCPNPLNIKDRGNSKSMLPVAVLGNADFDVEDIDPASILLAGVAPVRWSLDDVSGPMANGSPSACECTTDGPDGYMDLTLKFSQQEIIDALDSADNGDVIELLLTGTLASQGAFAGSDCVLIRGYRASDGRQEETLSGDLEGITLTNYPNPFNARTTITYNLDVAEHVRLSVYNILGQEVATLVDGPQESGQHSVSWDGKTSSGDVVSSGMYFYRISTEAVTESRKMILLK